jgi:hypothetical protein
MEWVIMLEDFSLEALVYYLEAHPLIAVLLVVMIVVFLGSLLRKLIKIAVICGLLFLGSLYYTNIEASEDWRVRAKMVKGQAALLGKEALKKGAELLQEGKKELDKQLEAR